MTLRQILASLETQQLRTFQEIVNRRADKLEKFANWVTIEDTSREVENLWFIADVADDVLFDRGNTRRFIGG